MIKRDTVERGKKGRRGRAGRDVMGQLGKAEPTSRGDGGWDGRGESQKKGRNGLPGTTPAESVDF